MNVLFSMRHSGALRNFASTLRALAQRGHQIHVVFMMPDKRGDGRLLRELASEHPEITFAEVAGKAPWTFWLGIARGVRMTADYLRYRTPEYADAHALRDRAAIRVPGVLMALLRLPLVRTRAGLRLVGQILLLVERAIPVDASVASVVAERQPDVVLVTPLVDLGSDQVEYLKAARALGVRSGLAVHSWDNLTNKGLIRIQPDRVFVWNEAQKREAVTMHGVAPEDVVVTGAPVYDQWFARVPSTARDEFCRKAALPAERPFFLYLCSSPFIAPDEANFVAAWIRAVRSAPDARVRTAGIMVRPHPDNLQPWQQFDAAQFADVAIWPRGGADPIDKGSKNDYFDSMFHAAAAVGINTSAQIEAGIVGRPVYSLRVPEYASTQEGTLHFHYLLNEGGGLLHMADTLEQHVADLAGALDRTDADAARLQAFVRAFVRPHGLQVDATPLLADSIAALAGQPKAAPERLAAGLYVVRALLYPIGLALKAVRRSTRISRKRERQLKPVTRGHAVSTRLAGAAARAIRWAPAREFAKRYIVARMLPQIAAGRISTPEAAALPKILQRLGESRKPIVVGPWLGDVALELLYWIPFLNWVRNTQPFDPERLVVLSRGGAAPWYRNVAPRYLDLYDFYTPDQVRLKAGQQARPAELTHLVPAEFEREIVKLASQHLGSRDVERLHPTYMYRLFSPYWKGQMPVSLVEAHASFERLPAAAASDLARELPREYTAVRFQFSEAFPDTADNRALCEDALRTLTDTGNVVVLNGDPDGGDRWMPERATSGRVHTLDHLVTPRNSLEVQTAVIGGARAFVGAYDGLSYLAPLCGVPAVSFYSRREGLSAAHLDLARRVFARVTPGSYAVFDTTDLGVLGRAFGGRSGIAQALAAALPGGAGGDAPARAWVAGAAR